MAAPKHPAEQVDNASSKGQSMFKLPASLLLRKRNTNGLFFKLALARLQGASRSGTLLAYLSLCSLFSSQWDQQPLIRFKCAYESRTGPIVKHTQEFGVRLQVRCSLEPVDVFFAADRCRHAT